MACLFFDSEPKKLLQLIIVQMVFFLIAGSLESAYGLHREALVILSQEAMTP